MASSDSENVQKARRILSGEKASVHDMLLLAERLRDDERFESARKLIDRAYDQIESDAAMRLRLTLLYARCAYYDPGLPNDEPLDRALELLDLLPKQGELDLLEDRQAFDLRKGIQALKDVREAKRLLLGAQHAKHDNVYTLAKRLKNEQYFGYARRIIGLVRDAKVDEKQRRKMVELYALCTYKDPNLPFKARLDRALNLLETAGNLSITRSQETLGLAGAIHKLRWTVDGQKHHLERALFYYRRGYQIPANEAGEDYDHGYTGINAAFVLDLLASQELQELPDDLQARALAHTYRQEAAEIRWALVKDLIERDSQKPDLHLQKEWWFLVTIAEAYFGLGYQDAACYDQAGEYLKRAMQLPHTSKWEFATTARQLAFLARLQDHDPNAAASFEETPAGQTLLAFLVYNLKALPSDYAVAQATEAISYAVRSSFVGKVGLALSGGGFRASLFHIGVLAKLAELDLLRMVEVLSCVSGGSIIGAHYYLEVRRLLTQKPDWEITHQDYIAIVERVADCFLAGVQQNIRMRMFLNPLKNLKMIGWRDYSRTYRIGELFEEKLFAAVADGEAGLPRLMRKCFVKPCSEQEDFAPKHENWRRGTKVPILILNGTTLNTGHNWQFTASFMGEPPGRIDTEIDSNYRLRRMYYGEAPKPYSDMRLGTAVAASACVPGLFDPIELARLYTPPQRAADEAAPGFLARLFGRFKRDAIVVQLVDGGVHDNQGVVGLLEQDCSLLLVSDASGQMEAQDSARNGLLDVPLRSNNILMARVREAQYADLEARQSASLLRGLMFVHLKKYLHGGTRDWRGCGDPPDRDWTDGLHRQGTSPHDAATDQDDPKTSHEMPKAIQRHLAAIRTDLDSFSDVEAYGLMTSGYRMTESEIRKIKALPTASHAPHNWSFLAFEEKLRQDPNDVSQLLAVANNRFFKLFRIWWFKRTVRVLVGLLSATAAVALVWAWWTWRSWLLLSAGITLGALGIGVVVLAGLFVALPLIMRLRGYRKSLAQIGMGLFMGSVGWIAALIQVYILDKGYLQRGRINVNDLAKRRPVEHSGESK